MQENNKFYVAIITFLAIVFMSSYYVIQSGQQDTYTVLYFSNPDKPVVYSQLPLRTPDESTNPVTVNFTIENHENQNLNYAYAIKLNDLELIKKDITLRNNEVATFSEDITVEKVHDNLNISVQLYKEGIDEVYRQIWYDIINI